MSSILRKDKIGNLSHSAGNILLAPSILTIGGRQYETTSTLSVALPAMTANTRYQVYAVQTAGVVSLVISQNENSVGPAGYASWKLVGSLYANGASPVAFGAFISITGTPISGPVTGELWDISAITTPPTIGTTDINRIDWIRVGSRLQAWYRLDQGGSGGAAGSGAYLPKLPTNLQFASNRYILDTGISSNERSDQYIGGGVLHQPTVTLGLVNMKPYSATRFIVRYSDIGVTQEWSNTAIALSNNNVRAGLNVDAFIEGWSDTPIEDL